MVCICQDLWLLIWIWWVCHGASFWLWFPFLFWLRKFFFFLAIWLSCVVKCCVQVICVQISLFYCLVFSPWLFIYYRVYGVLGYDPHVEVRGLLFGVSSLLLVSYGAWGWTQVVRLVPLCFAPEQLTPPWRNSVAVYVIMLLPLPLACCFTLVVILSSLLWIF